MFPVSQGRIICWLSSRVSLISSPLGHGAVTYVPTGSRCGLRIYSHRPKSAARYDSAHAKANIRYAHNSAGLGSERWSKRL